MLPQETPAQNPHNEQAYPIRKYLLRNWSTVPPRYYVQWDTPSKELGWAYEDAALISDIVTYEKVNGILPETGITVTNKNASASKVSLCITPDKLLLLQRPQQENTHSVARTVTKKQ